MKIRYIYSACVVVETPDAKILSDPWFTPGAYDGSWYQYPVLPDPVATIGPVDVIYISHIHPDHYDPVFLRRYFASYPRARLVIGPQVPPYLAHKMRLDGFAPEIVETLKLGGTELLIVPNVAGGGDKNEIDSALAIRCGGQSVLNLNDNPFVPDQVAQLLAFCPGGRPDFALLPYSGAGPYPQTFTFADHDALVAAVAHKRRQFLKLFATYLAALDPRKAMPFAGKYYLGGRLAPLNRYRGVPDAVDTVALDDSRVIVLADGGHATYDIAIDTASAARTHPYDADEIDRALAARGDIKFDYECEIVPASGRELPLLPLIAAAKRRARQKISIDAPYWLVLRTEREARSFVLNLADDDVPRAAPGDTPYDNIRPRLEITIDDRYLFGLLTRLYHWNNAEIGSQYRSLRAPDEYRPEVYRFLSMFQV